jgi:hypothetical protein
MQPNAHGSVWKGHSRQRQASGSKKGRQRALAADARRREDGEAVAHSNTMHTSVLTYTYTLPTQTHGANVASRTHLTSSSSSNL